MSASIKPADSMVIAGAGALSTVAHDEPSRATPTVGAKSTPTSNGGQLGAMRTPIDPPRPLEPVYIDEQELSHRTTLSRTTLQTMRRKGGGPPFAKLGHRVVYRLADVERWIAERTR